MTMKLNEPKIVYLFLLFLFMILGKPKVGIINNEKRKKFNKLGGCFVLCGDVETGVNVAEIK